MANYVTDIYEAKSVKYESFLNKVSLSFSKKVTLAFFLDKPCSYAEICQVQKSIV